MVTDQEIANGVESLLRQANPNVTFNGVVQQLEEKLGLNLSHKAGFIRDHIELLLQSRRPLVAPPNPTRVPTSLHQQHPKDHFALQHHPQFHPHQHPQLTPSHFALLHHQQQQQQQQQRRAEELNFGYHQQRAHPNLNVLPPGQNQYHQQQQQHHQLQSGGGVGGGGEGFGPNVNVNVPAAAAVGGTVEAPPKESAPTGTKRRGGPGGLNKVCGVSPELQAIVGEPALPRTQIVKQLWAYIRKNNLQDPSNKRKIICDEPLRLVFETDCTDMFKMNKLLAKHIIPLEPKKEPGPDSKRAKVEKVEVESATGEREREVVQSDAGSSTMVISEALASFLETGEREMVQSDAVRRVWEYIRVNQLTDPHNSMMIICDAKLQELLRCESTSVLGISEMLMPHFFKKS